MVRTYVRSTTRASWSAQALATALNEIQNGIPIRISAKKHAIPEATLRRRLKIGLNDKGRFGRNPTFTKEQEVSLSDQILKVARLCYKISSYDIRKIAYVFAEENNIPHRFSKEIGLAGKEWYMVYIKRHPELNSFILPKQLSGFVKESVKSYFDKLEELIERHNFSRDKIFNVDITVHKIPKMLPKNQSNVIASTEKTVTVFCAFSASGLYIPPLFFFPDGPSYKITTRKTFFGVYSKNDWNKEEFLLQWLIYFQNYIKSSTADPILLILDHHFCNQLTQKIFDFCGGNGIVLLGIPIHTFHKLQPIDQNFMHLLTTAYNKDCDEILKLGSNKSLKSSLFTKVDETNFSEIFDRAYTKVAMENDAQFAFESCGIFPFNRNKFTAKDFAFAIEGLSSNLQIRLVDDESIF